MRNQWQIQTTNKIFETLNMTKRIQANKLALKQLDKEEKNRLKPEEILVRVLATNFSGRPELL